MLASLRTLPERCFICTFTNLMGKDQSLGGRP